MAAFVAEKSSKNECKINQNWGVGGIILEGQGVLLVPFLGSEWVLAPECVLGGVLGRLGGVLEASWAVLAAYAPVAMGGPADTRGSL